MRTTARNTYGRVIRKILRTEDSIGQETGVGDFSMDGPVSPFKTHGDDDRQTISGVRGKPVTQGGHVQK